jgi:hypothetical protein
VTVILASGQLYWMAREHLRGDIEQVGFFLADFDVVSDRFVLRDWRAISPEAFKDQSAYHVTLCDETRLGIIRWASQADACLIEVHSHGDHGKAGFSSTDIHGFEDWVPHVRWRLRARPYAAIVTTATAFDAIAWLDNTGEPSPIEQLEVDQRTCVPTGWTLSHWSELKELKP